MIASSSFERGVSRLRILPALAAGFLIAAAPAHAVLERANAYINGKQFGNGTNLKVTSGKEKINTSTLYSYEVVGKVSGTGQLAGLVKKKTKIGKFMNSISPGASKFLKGQFSNPGGKLPVVLYNGKISGSEKIKGLGKVKISMKAKVEILANGEISVKITKTKIKGPGGAISGTIKFLKGSKVIVTTAPKIEMALPQKGFSEASGVVQVEVTRFGYQKTACSVGYTSQDGTAVAGVDYSAVSGTVKFASGETRKSISVPLTDNLVGDGKRSFQILLSNPSKGAVIGPKSSMTVNILDND